jgi:hypothetical protein
MLMVGVVNGLNIVIPGGTGKLGNKLIPKLQNHDVAVLSRNAYFIMWKHSYLHSLAQCPSSSYILVPHSQQPCSIDYHSTLVYRLIVLLLHWQSHRRIVLFLILLGCIH